MQGFRRIRYPSGKRALRRVLGAASARLALEQDDLPGRPRPPHRARPERGDDGTEVGRRLEPGEGDVGVERPRLGWVADRLEERAHRRRQLHEQRVSLSDAEPQHPAPAFGGERAGRPELHRRPAHRERLECAGNGREVDPVPEELERQVPLRPRGAARGRGNLDRPRGGADGVEDVVRRDHGHEGPAQLGLAHPIDTSFIRSRLSNEIVANWRTISR